MICFYLWAIMHLFYAKQSMTKYLMWEKQDRTFSTAAKITIFELFYKGYSTAKWWKLFSF